MESIEDIGRPNAYISPATNELIPFVADLLEESRDVKKKTDVDKICQTLRKRHRIHPNKPDLRQTVKTHFPTTSISPTMQSWLIRKSCRTLSGVKVATLVLSPHKFSCKFDCAMCPQERNLQGEPTQPRSYLSSEPAMMRAMQTKRNPSSTEFDIRAQFQNRMETYEYNGIQDNGNSQTCEKIEVILSGGTWDSYPITYREQVICEVYWAANTFPSQTPRPIKSLLEEQEENETAKFRVIGLTIETRPDMIYVDSIKDYLRWGVTRVQIGVQHFDNAILKGINRKCSTQDTIEAIWLLKQAGFKVVVHLMPDLPGSNPELDKWMFDQALDNPDFQFDDVKLYPTAVVKSHDPNFVVDSKIADWYKNGTYKPYAEESLDTLIDVLLHFKRRVHPWIRIQRLVRDIPAKSIEAGYHKISNLRQVIHTKMEKENIKCRCLFCMEIGDRELGELSPQLIVRKYEASNGIEYFISFEAHKMSNIEWFDYHVFLFVSQLYWFLAGKRCYWDAPLENYEALFGFLRLRIDPNPGGKDIPEINGCGLIREVHVYGTSLGTGQQSVGSQHRGFGKRLIQVAEDITLQHGYTKTAVIAGIGTREYYKNKCGYTKGMHYMLKDIRRDPSFYHSANRLFFINLLVIAVFYMLSKLS
jgi:ELP3 family radical SAM enzyme/protein acetyltransferase